MRLWLLALMIVLFTTLAFAASLLELILPAIILMVVIVLAILWAASDALNMPQLRAWVKIEIRELIVAAVLIAIFYSAFFIQKTAAKALTGQEGYIESAQNSIKGTLLLHQKAFDDIIVLSSKITALVGFGYNYPLPAWFVSFSYTRAPYAGASAILGPITMAAQGEAGAIFIYKAMSVILDFFDSTVFTVIMPLGFILRAIPFSRQLGNTVIALSIGAAVIYPFSIILVKTAHELPGFNLPVAAISDSDFDKLSITVAQPMRSFCESDFARWFIGISEIGWALLICLPLAAACTVGYAACFNACYQLITNVIYPLAVIAFQLIMGLAIIITDEVARIDYETIFNITQAFLQNVNNLIVLSYVDVLLVGIVTVIGVKSVSSALGGESYLVGLQRLI